MVNPIVIKAHPDFVAIINQMKKETWDKNGINLSQTKATKILADQLKQNNNEIKINPWKIKLR